MGVSTSPRPPATARQIKAGIRAFFRLAEKWSLSREQQERLLGRSVKRTTLYEWEQHPPSSLNDDQIMRLSYLLAIYEGLQRVWRRTPDEADRWVRRPNEELPFNSRSPLSTMLDGGLPAMAAVRAHVDTAVGGPPSREESLRWLPEGPPLDAGAR